MSLACVGSILRVWAIQGGRYSPNRATHLPREWVPVCEALGRDRPLGLQAPVWGLPVLHSLCTSLVELSWAVTQFSDLSHSESQEDVGSNTQPLMA